MKLQLTCQSGVLRGQSWSLMAASYLIGRDRKCDIVIPDSSVSREHCILSMDMDDCYVQDLKSANGTLLNGRNVDSSSVVPGDELQIGTNTFLLIGVGGNDVTSDGVEPHSDSVFQRDTESILLSETPDVNRLRENPDTIADLAAVACMGRELCHARSRTEILGMAKRRLRRSCNPRSIRLIEPGGKRNLETALYEKRGRNTLPTQVGERMYNRLREQDSAVSGFLEQVRTHDQSTCVAAARLVVAGKFLGAIVVELPDDAYSNSERYVDFLVAFCATLGPYLQSVEHMERLEDENVRLRNVSNETSQFVGESPTAREIKDRIALAAKTDLNVLITGESGVGKEVAAQILHALSSRHRQPLVRLNCAAVSPELFLSELFGHEKGGFTGAERTRRGFAKMADQGTLFLDEIADIPLRSQAALLRFVETKRFYPVGSDEEQSVDVRVIAATNRNVDDMVRTGEFREDLYHRLSSMRIDIPPLWARPEDIPLLAEHFFNGALRNAQRPLLGIDPSALQALKEHAWRGNARELRNVIERAVAFATGNVVTLEDVNRWLEKAKPTHFSFPAAPQHSLACLENEYIRHVFMNCGENVRETCDVLGIGKSTLYRKLEELGLHPKQAKV